MSRTHRLSVEQLRETLRHGDPAHDDRLSPDECRQLRERSLRAAPIVGRRASAAWAPAVAAVVVAVLGVVGITIALRQVAQPTGSHAVVVPSGHVQTAPHDTMPHSDTAEARSSLTQSHGAEHRTAAPANSPSRRYIGTPSVGLPLQQIQMTTPGGTRIVWVLNPRFGL
jgi:hypothetical protein